MSPEDSPMPFPILELFCRSAGKDYDDKVIRSFMGKEKYYPQLENPEYIKTTRGNFLNPRVVRLRRIIKF